ncbi:MAG: recombination protein O N-terminal domain-containing protein [Candidatus Paceibacterota bacterium]
MSYHIYTTAGIVLKKNHFNEANSLFYILTEDLGLIIASAQGVRLQSSKLGSSLQEFSLVTLSCVKGKGGWKITNSIARENFFFDKPIYVQKFITNLSRVLIRMMPGEENNQDIFYLVEGSFSWLKNLSKESIDSFEILCNLRVLHNLGYVDRNPGTEVFLGSSDKWDELLLCKVLKNKNLLLGYINKGLKESHL